MVNIRGPGSLYIVQEREHIGKFVNGTNCQVVKIGRTHDVPERMKAYPKGSILLTVVQVNNMLRAENVFINVCAVKFESRRDLGAEYFECDLIKLQEVVFGLALHQFQYNWKDSLGNDESVNEPTQILNECNPGHGQGDATLLFHEFAQSSIDFDSCESLEALDIYKKFKAFYVERGCHAKVSYKTFACDLYRYYKIVEIPFHSFANGLIGPAFDLSMLQSFVIQHESQFVQTKSEKELTVTGLEQFSYKKHVKPKHHKDVTPCFVVSEKKNVA